MGVEQVRIAEPGYRLSPINRVLIAVKKLPLPYWLVYLGLFLIEAALFHLISWQDGWVPRYSLEPIDFLYPLWLWGPLLAMTYLDDVAKYSLRAFAPMLDDDPETIASLEVAFTSMPAGPVLITGLVWLLVYTLFMLATFETVLQIYQLGPLAMWWSGIMGLITFPIGGALYYHSIRQLRLVSQTLGRVKHFNLFRLEPVYAFSGLTARTGLVWLVMLTLTQVFFPLTLVSGPQIIIYVVQALLVFAAFVLPLWNVHQRLVDEKRRLLADINQRLESKLQRLHRSLDADHLDELDGIRQAIGGLQDEREILSKIPTWPWRTETLTGFASAMLLPIVLFLIQLVLERLLTP